MSSNPIVVGKHSDCQGEDVVARIIACHPRDRQKEPLPHEGLRRWGLNVDDLRFMDNRFAVWWW